MSREWVWEKDDLGRTVARIIDRTRFTLDPNKVLLRSADRIKSVKTGDVVEIEIEQSRYPFVFRCVVPGTMMSAIYEDYP